MKIEKRQIVIIAVLVAMILGFIFLQYIPTTRAIKNAKQTKQQMIKDNEKAVLASQELPQLKARLADLKLQVGNFDAKLPQNRDYGSFLQEISVFMSANELIEQQVKNAEETSYDLVNAIPINMECAGLLEKVFNFFTALEQSQRIFNLDQVTIDNPEYSGNIKMVAKGDIYYRK